MWEYMSKLSGLKLLKVMLNCYLAASYGKYRSESFAFKVDPVKSQGIYPPKDRDFAKEPLCPLLPKIPSAEQSLWSGWSAHMVAVLINLV